jgi:GT2 family glycosyltransferase
MEQSLPQSNIGNSRNIRPNRQSDLTIAAVIPLYNGAPFIAETLRSVFAQTRAPDEIIVVDDGSTDRGADIVNRVAGDQAIVLRQSNQGQSSARNAGIAHASSDLIALLDHDDIWYPTHLEELIAQFMIDPGLGWAYSNSDWIDLSGAVILPGYLDSHGSVHPKRSALHCVAEDAHVLPSSSLISKAALEAVGGFDVRLSGYEDDDLFGRLFRAGRRNAYLSKPLVGWRHHPGSSGRSPRMQESRAIYAQSLLASYLGGTPQEQKIAMGVILPRFLDNFAYEAKTALRQRDYAALGRTLDRYAFLLRYLPGWQRGLLGCVRPLLGNWCSATVVRRLTKRCVKRLPGLAQLNREQHDFA